MTSRLTRFAITLGAAALSATAFLVALSASAGSAADPEVRVYFAICEGSTATDTVKIKRIREDGTGVTTIGDTTIAHCVPNSPATTYFTGLAVHSGYVYFSWSKADGSAAGVGRLSATEGGAANLNFAPAPSGVGWFQLAPRILNDYLYFYAHNGGGAPSNLRVMRVGLTGGTVQDCFAPAGSPNSMAIGVGKDAVYYTTDLADKKLFKVASDCASSTEHFDLANGNGEAIVHQLDYSYGASLIAESSTRIEILTNHLVTNKYGISHIDAGGDANNFAGHGTATAADSNPLASLVWGINHWYFKNGNATKMYRATPGSAAVEIFASQMSGVLHHMSVVQETPESPTTTTTTTTTVAATPSPTNAPATTAAAASSTTATTSTVAATTTTAAVATTTVAATTTTTSVATFPKTGFTAARVASLAQIRVPKGAKVGITVAAPSRKVCAVRAGRLVALKSGSCRVTATVTPKTGKSTRKTVTLRTS